MFISNGERILNIYFLLVNPPFSIVSRNYVVVVYVFMEQQKDLTLKH